MYINQIIHVVPFQSFVLENFGKCGTLSAKGTKYREMHTVSYPYPGFNRGQLTLFPLSWFLLFIHCFVSFACIYISHLRCVGEQRRNTYIKIEKKMCLLRRCRQVFNRVWLDALLPSSVFPPLQRSIHVVSKREPHFHLWPGRQKGRKGCVVKMEMTL